MRRRSGFVIAINFWNRASRFADRTFCVLSFANIRRANFPQFPMGYFAAGNRLFVDFFRAVANLAAGIDVVARGIRQRSGGPAELGYDVAASAVFASISSL